MNDSTIQNIQAALDECRPIRINKRKLELRLHKKNNDRDYLARSIEWLNQSLTDNVHTLHLDMIYCGYKASDEQKLFDLAKSRKNLEIHASVDEYSVWATVVLKKIKSRTIISATYHNPADSELFEYFIPKELPDILTNHGAIKISTKHLFGDITIEKDSPTSSVTITGIQFDYRISDASEEYLEFVSKIPTLKAVVYDLNLGEKIDKFIEFLKVNASSLRELNIMANRGYKDSMIDSINNIISQFKTLKKLDIYLYPDNNNGPQLHALAENTNIKQLKIECGSNINFFMEPLRRNKTIKDISIDFAVKNRESLSSVKELMQILAEKTCLRRLEININIHEHCECADKTYDELLLTALANTNITSLCLIGASFNEEEYDHVTHSKRNYGCTVDQCGRLINDSSIWMQKKIKRNSNDSLDNNEQNNSSSGISMIIQSMLANPHLTSVEVDDGDIPLVLQHHLDENKRKRDEARIGLITLMYNIARSKSDSILPQEVWCHIVSFIAYPGIDQPFNQILRELFQNSAVRQVVKQ